MRGAYRTPVAGTRTAYVQCLASWGQAALRLRYIQYSTQGAGKRGRYVQYGGRRALRVSSGDHELRRFRVTEGWRRRGRLARRRGRGRRGRRRGRRDDLELYGGLLGGSDRHAEIR